MKKTFRMKSLVLSVLVFLSSLAILSLSMYVPWAAAQDSSYPNKPINIVVPYPPGGGNDTV
ncbi:MAG: hypothetical protein KKF01_04410, partial [Proteobacteria bacterium]|nr:hypothetical protein [Pseudomonadota bacterium]